MPIVVAVDGSAGSGAALRLAEHEARCRQTSLLAVIAYRAERVVVMPAGKPVGSMRTGEEERDAAELLLRDTIVSALGERAERVAMRVVDGPAGKAVVDTARTERAELIVLAARPGLTVIPGTVTQYVLRNAGRPILIVPTSGQAATGD
jgi:nucleotide-binding universal stress UspA family protein